MDYRVFNVRTFLCMHIHTGVGHTDNESEQHFGLGKSLTNFSCAPNGNRTSGHGIHWISRPTLHQLSHHVPPIAVLPLTAWCCLLQRSSPGWPRLEELSLAMSSSGGTKIPPPIDDALLRRWVFSDLFLPSVAEVPLPWPIDDALLRRWVFSDLFLPSTG